MKPLSTLILVSAIIGSCLCALLASCHETSHPAYTPLTATAIYVIDTVRMAAQGGDEKAAAGILDQAAELYKKGPDTAKSIELFKQSILLKPTARAYYDLAGALVTTHQYTEAIQALYIAEKLGFTPLANVMYRYTLAYSNLKHHDDLGGTWHDSSLYYMGLTIQMGYQRPQQFLRRDLFPGLAARSEGDELYKEVLSGGSGYNMDRTLWEIYKSHFFPVQLPLVIDDQWINNHHSPDNPDISYDFAKFISFMENDHWEREPDYEYYYVGVVTENPVYSAMLYSIEPSEQQDSPLVVSYYLSTYNNKGNIIDTLQVAGSQESGSTFKVFSIQSSLQFSVQDFVYPSDSTASGGNDSAGVIHRNALPAVTFRIADDGKFEKVGALTSR